MTAGTTTMTHHWNYSYDHTKRPNKPNDQTTNQTNKGSKMTYEQREITKAHKQISELSNEPLKIRQENRSQFARDMQDNPDAVVERIEWMIDGNYGYGPYLICQDVLTRKRMNRVAMLSQLLGSFEWDCSSLEARKAYLSLTKQEQNKINKGIQELIDELSNR